MFKIFLLESKKEVNSAFVKFELRTAKNEHNLLKVIGLMFNAFAFKYVLLKTLMIQFKNLSLHLLLCLFSF